MIPLKGQSHLGKNCYIRGGSVLLNTFDATVYESVLRFSKYCLVLKKSSFEILNNFDYVTSFEIRIVTKFRGIYCECNTISNEAGIVLGHEHTFHSRFAYKQVRRKLMRLRRVTFHMNIYGISPILKIKHNFFRNTTTFRTLTAQILVLQPRRQLGYHNSR